MKRFAGIRRRGLTPLVVLALCLGTTGTLAAQSAGPGSAQAKVAKGFKQFTDRVQAYLQVQKAVISDLPALESTDLPEMITAYQQAMARKLREARPRAKAGDLFTSSARDAFRHACRAALEGSRPERSRAYMQTGAPNPQMKLAVNAIYPDAEPVTTLPPELLAAFPALPADIAYRVVGRSLIVIDVKSGLIIDVARRILPPAS